MQIVSHTNLFQSKPFEMKLVQHGLSESCAGEKLQ